MEVKGCSLGRMESPIYSPQSVVVEGLYCGEGSLLPSSLRVECVVLWGYVVEEMR